jgi:hypothetical protein
MPRTTGRYALFALAIFAHGATAQIPKLPAGLGNIAGSALPNIGSIGVGNAAGVLKYCMKNSLVSGNSADSVLQMKGSSLSLDSIKGEAKQKACKAVLKQAKNFL